MTILERIHTMDKRDGRQEELEFWERYDIKGRKSLISRDFVRSIIEDQVKHPDGSLVPDVILLTQNSGKLVTGMQRMRVEGCDR